MTNLKLAFNSKIENPELACGYLKLHEGILTTMALKVDFKANWAKKKQKNTRIPSYIVFKGKFWFISTWCVSYKYDYCGSYCYANFVLLSEA